MVGFTPDLVVALWIGTDHRLGLIGANEEVTVDAWTRFMLEAEPFLEGGSFRQPPGSELAGNDPEKQGVKGFRQKKLLEEDRERRREEQRALQQMEQGSL
jgi:membrane carboxypeptidase/penicillin-binding protein